MKNLTKKLAPVVLGLALLTGCGQNPIEILEENKGKQTKTIQKGDTYWDYAKEIQKKNPELAKLDIRDLCAYLKEFNDGKELRYGESAELPKY